MVFCFMVVSNSLPFSKSLSVSSTEPREGGKPEDRWRSTNSGFHGEGDNQTNKNQKVLFLDNKSSTFLILTVGAEM